VSTSAESGKEGSHFFRLLRFEQGKKNDIAGSPLLPILPLLALDQVRLVDEIWPQKGTRAVFEDLDENEPRERGSDKIRDEKPKQGQNQLTCTGKKTLVTFGAFCLSTRRCSSLS
jgi:hypothetical protein